MADIVGGVGTSHAPGMTGWPEQATEEEQRNVFGALEEVRAFVAEQRPDVIVAFLDDHFENHFRPLMPAITVASSPNHYGPGEHYFGLLKMQERHRFDGAEARAEHLLSGLIARDFDVTRMGEAEFGNNLIVPLHYIRPEFDIAVIPVFLNVWTPPQITMRRANDLGLAIRDVVSEWNDRVLFMGTGGLSHWPPFWLPDHSERDDSMILRMKRFQTEGREAVLADDPEIFTDVGQWEIDFANDPATNVVNPEWDRWFLDRIGGGDIDALTSLTYDEVEAAAGHGAYEIVNWIALAGAMGNAACRTLAYEATPAWICGTGVVLYGSDGSGETHA